MRPFDRFSVHLHALGKWLPQDLLHACILQLPDSHRVEVEWQLPGAAVRHRLSSRFRIGLTFAVAEEAHYVEVFEMPGLRYAREGVRNLDAKDTIGKAIQQALGT
jgi:hypothetical protein